MKREPMVFTVAGMIFGFVLGYMAAGMGDRPASDPHPRPDRAERSPAGSGGGAAASPAAERDRPAGPADPDEVKTLENLAVREKQNAQVRIELGNLYMDHAQYDDASRWYKEALALKPEDNDVRVDLGASLLNLGRVPDALAEFDQALQKDPAHKKAAFNKGLALMQAGRAKEAVAVWDGLLKRYPGDPQLQGLRDQVERIRAGRAETTGPS
ncbi:MAG TPA: tetratricopeptide repeat protein [Vicinamibacteria bacterium]|nr:tetratricopeptide repeat protein [Vicinamibacteria bacterium]